MVEVNKTMVRTTKSIVETTNTVVKLAKIMESGIGTLVCINNTMDSRLKTSVTAAQKMVSVAPAKVCEVLSTGF